MTVSARQITPLFDNRTLSRLERMRLIPGRRLTNRSQGEHLSGKGGTSTEFSDYRDYVAGDDIRYVDWNIFSRLNRPYVKLYRFEEEMHVVVIIDASASMNFEDKLLRAKQLAAACGLMGLMNLERVSVYACQTNQSDPLCLPPTSGRAGMARLFEFIEGVEPGGECPIDEAVDAVLKRHRGRGIAVVLSDFLTFGDLARPFNVLFSRGLETFAVQILSPTEADPEFTGDVRFVDSETNTTLDVSSAGELLGIYHEHRMALENRLGALCRQRSARFLATRSDEPLDHILFSQLRRRGWVR